MSRSQWWRRQRLAEAKPLLKALMADGLIQGEIGQMVGVTPSIAESTVYNWLAGRAYPTEAQLCQIIRLHEIRGLAMPKKATHGR